MTVPAAERPTPVTSNGDARHDIQDSAPSYPTLAPAALRAAQAETLARPLRKHSLAAKALFVSMDLLYGRNDTLAKFRVLEIVARVPYQAWEHVAYIAITHTSETPSFAREVHDRVVRARAEQDNEQWHLLILEELLHARGERHGMVRGRLLPQLLALAYYQLSWLLYVIRPSLSHRLNADFEDHAEHAYMGFVRDNPWVDATPWTSEFSQDYGPQATLGDLLRQIGHDERLHREESEALIEMARFGATPGAV